MYIFIYLSIYIHKHICMSIPMSISRIIPTKWVMQAYVNNDVLSTIDCQHEK